MPEIAQRIKKVRKARKLSQKEFAESLAVDQGHISKVERGIANPSNQLLNSMCRKFNVEEKWLSEGKSELSIEDGLTREEIDDFEANREKQSTLGLINYLSASSDIIMKMVDWMQDAMFAFDALGKPDDKLLKAKQDLFDTLSLLESEVTMLFHYMANGRKPNWANRALSTERRDKKKKDKKEE